MKETYIAPKVEIVEFDKKTDIIRTSGAMPQAIFNDNIGKGIDMGTQSYTDLID